MAQCGQGAGGRYLLYFCGCPLIWMTPSSRRVISSYVAVATAHYDHSIGTCLIGKCNI